jgi:hypothetical protein
MAATKGTLNQIVNASGLDRAEFLKLLRETGRR